MRRDWYKFAKGIRGIVPDTALSPGQIARSNLFLFGTPKTHAVLARIGDKFPIKFTAAGYEILGRPYKATDTTGLMFIYPNPLAPDRYVVVCSGAHYGKRLPTNHKYDLLPDFILYSSEPDYDDSNAYYCAGFFDNAWKLDASLVWTSDGRPKPAPQASRLPVGPAAAPLPPEPTPVAPKAPARP
jgi:hypothetical protein